MSISVKHSLLITAAMQFFIKCLLQHSVKLLLLAKVFLSLQLVLQLELGSEDYLHLLSFHLQRQPLESRQIMGKPINILDYT